MNVRDLPKERIAPIRRMHCEANDCVVLWPVL